MDGSVILDERESPSDDNGGWLVGLRKREQISCAM